MFSKIILSVAFISALVLAPDAYAGRVELTTYYPAPFGEYRTLRATGADSTGTVAFQAGGSTTPAGLAVTNSNLVGIRTTAPADVLEVVGNHRVTCPANTTVAYVFTPGSDGYMRLYDGSNNYRMFAARDLWAQFTLTVGGGITASSVNVSSGNITAGSFTYYSDKRLKENIVPVSDSLEKIGRLTGVNFTFKDHPGEKHLGLIAQEVEPVVPEVVRTQADGMKSVDYAALVALLIQGMKEQQQEINALREELGQVKTAVISGR